MKSLLSVFLVWLLSFGVAFAVAGEVKEFEKILKNPVPLAEALRKAIPEEDRLALTEKLRARKKEHDVASRVSKEQFQKSFFGVPAWGAAKKTGTANYTLFSEQKRARVHLYVRFYGDGKQMEENFAEEVLFGRAFPSKVFDGDFSVPIGDCGLFLADEKVLYFSRGNVFVRLVADSGEASDQDVWDVARKLDALFRGNAEFLPEDDPELVAIRKAYQEARDRKEREWREEFERRERERQEAEHREIVEKCLLPERLSAERSESASEIEAFSARMKEKGWDVPAGAPIVPLTASVPVAGERDAVAWRKLSVSRARSVFSDWEEWRNAAEDWHPLFFSFRMSKARKLPGDSERDWVRAEVVHAGTPEEARQWAAYLRFKYMDKSERARGASPEQIAKGTNANAFPDLGNENISWRGRMNSAFLPDEKTAETLIVFIRGTTVVCLKSERSDFSVLPFARAFDALLLAPAPAADAFPEPPAE